MEEFLDILHDFKYYDIFVLFWTGVAASHWLTELLRRNTIRTITIKRNSTRRLKSDCSCKYIINAWDAWAAPHSFRYGDEIHPAVATAFLLMAPYWRLIHLNSFYEKCQWPHSTHAVRFVPFTSSSAQQHTCLLKRRLDEHVGDSKQVGKKIK